MESVSDHVIVMYDPSGVQQWAARYGSPGTSDDEARAIAADRAGSAYITWYINDFRHGNTASIRYEPSLTDNEAEQD